MPQRKTRCDPGLPRCGPCERTNSFCEYFDPAKGVKIPRNYVVHLQHKVRALERQLEELEKEEHEPDPEDMMRGPANVRLGESDESKFLGPSSGIAITRLVMQLAKEFNDSKSITEIVNAERKQFIRSRFQIEEDKPTSKVYPLTSDVAAEELPARDLTTRLVLLFFLKGMLRGGRRCAFGANSEIVHPMYPIFHEPTFLSDVETVYSSPQTATPYQQFCLRMVIAISLQKMDTQYAGLADSYYLSALQYFEACVKLMNLQTLQCFALIGGYSLLTPTRTAVYYVVGLAIRLAQTLGIHEEKTIARNRDGTTKNALELDMSRRVFWLILTMDYGLAHSLGRPSCIATLEDHLDVQFPAQVDDEYIRPDGIVPGAPPSLKKWIAVHFFRMRLLQLEIRRKLYQVKRPEPKDDSDPWFKQMEAKLVKWRDTSPEMDAGSGLNKVWYVTAASALLLPLLTLSRFIGRYNTMVVFLFRPSPQVPRPSVRAAGLCYDACEYNIYMQRRQIETKSVDLTWIFTQSIFMAVNTILWALSYEDVRRAHPREEVEKHLMVAMEAITLASDRWPGVTSALELYQTLIEACLRVYDKDGDIPLSTFSPSETSTSTAERASRSRTTSPATVSTHSVATPPEKTVNPFRYLGRTTSGTEPHGSPTSSAPDMSNFSPNQASNQRSPYGSGISDTSSPAFNPMPQSYEHSPGHWNPSFSYDHRQPTSLQQSHSSPHDYSLVEPLSSPGQSSQGRHPSSTPLAQHHSNGSIDLNGTTSPLAHQQPLPASSAPATDPLTNLLSFQLQPTDYLYPQSTWPTYQESHQQDLFGREAGAGLTAQQQMELMQVLETDGMDVMDGLIEEGKGLFYPGVDWYGTAQGV